MTTQEHKRLDVLLRHVENVRNNCERLGKILIEDEEEEFGRKLISLGRIHDASKFSGIEWEFLNPETKELEPEKFKLAAFQHITTNPHHPEYWGDIHSMPRIYLAEFSCDILARSTEFGDSAREWIKDIATKKYNFSTCGSVYKTIKSFLDKLLEQPFK